jgi:hypothetical protein
VQIRFQATDLPTTTTSETVSLFSPPLTLEDNPDHSAHPLRYLHA